MNDKIKRKMKQTTSKLTDEEIAVQKYQKKAVLKTTQEVDQTTGEILKETKTYNSQDKREKGTFYNGSPEELIRFTNIICNNKYKKEILEYIITNIKYSNEFSFDKKWLNTYFPANKIKHFYTSFKFLIDNKIVFKTTKRNTYTLNVQLFNRMSLDRALKLYQEQFGETNEEEINIFTFCLKKAQLLNKKQKQELIEILKKDL